MSQQIYSKADLFADGVLIAEATGITINHRPSLNAVNTINKGFAGVSPGTKSAEIQLESAVPRVGVDYDYTDAMNTNKLIEVVVFARGKKLKTKGFISDMSERYGVDQAASLSITLMCGPIAESTL